MGFASEQLDPSEPWVREIEMLDPSACAHWAERVMGQRPHWTERHPSLPFFTLGMAAYLDAVPSAARRGGQAPYYATALRRHHNRLLQDHFGPLLALACEALGGWTDKRGVCDAASTALPGFHIHLAHPVFTQPVASKHRDLQFQLVFPGRVVAPTQVLTFTLPLSLPEGAGLNLWQPGQSTDDAEGQAQFHPYRLGQMAIHSGLLAHQAVLFPGAHQPPRIMLQGHALIDGDAVLLYW